MHPTSCSGPTAISGEPTLVITISTLCRTRHASSSFTDARRMIRLGHTGAIDRPAYSEVATSASNRVSHASSCSTVRALATGNAPITPALVAATTRSGPDTESIGAAISGRTRRFAMLSGSGIVGSSD
jgi:hypothetical protein